MNCKTCAAYAPSQPGSKQGMCRLHAPVTMIITIPAAPATAIPFIGQKNGQMQPQQPQQSVQGFFPPVHEDIWCLEWRQRAQAEDRPQPMPIPN